MAIPNQLKSVVDLGKREALLVFATVKEKGVNRFGRTLGLAAALVTAAYFGVYAPPEKMILRVQKDIDRAKLLSDSTAQYKDLRDQLLIGYARLPRENDRAQWLTDSVRESLNSAGLVTEEFRPVREQDSGGLVLQTTSVSLTIRFQEFYDWLLRLENAKPMMQVASLELVKKAESVGYARVSCDISTAIPKRRYH